MKKEENAIARVLRMLRKGWTVEEYQGFSEHKDVQEITMRLRRKEKK